MQGVPGKQKVLIVDDMPANIKILGEAIRSKYEISVATNGKAAIDKSQKDLPDLILLDIVMPGMDGYEICRRLKENERTKDIPIIFVTAKDDVQDEAKGLELGAVDYITKPFVLPIVMARVDTHLRLKRKTDLLEKLVHIDGLTEIPNRRMFDETLEREWKRHERQAHALALIMIDIDHFKKYNDHYGHARGDECLKIVAQTISSNLNRPNDLAARFGGEEFAVLLPETELEGATTIGTRLCRMVAALQIPHAANTAASTVTISLGAAALTPTGNQEPLRLIQHADQALYRAKEGGRNRLLSAEPK